MAVVYYENSIIECLSTDEKPEVANGWFLKELDTGVTFLGRGGEWKALESGFSFIKATKSGLITTDENGEYSIVFNTPLVNDEYTVAMSCEDMGINPPAAYAYGKTASGFSIITRNTRSGQAYGNVVVSWLVTLNYNP